MQNYESKDSKPSAHSIFAKQRKSPTEGNLIEHILEANKPEPLYPWLAPIMDAFWLAHGSRQVFFGGLQRLPLTEIREAIEVTGGYYDELYAISLVQYADSIYVDLINAKTQADKEHAKATRNISQSKFKKR